MKRGLVLEGDGLRGLFTAGAAMLIAPERPLDISRICHDPDRMRAVYEVGRLQAESALNDISRFLCATGSR